MNKDNNEIIEKALETAKRSMFINLDMSEKAEKGALRILELELEYALKQKDKEIDETQEGVVRLSKIIKSNQEAIMTLQKVAEKQNELENKVDALLEMQHNTVIRNAQEAIDLGKLNN